MKKITKTLILIGLVISFESIAQVSQSWVSLFNFAGTNSEEPTDMAVDPDGNIYITGWTWGTTKDDIVTLKYNASGELLWSQHFNGTKNADDQAEAIAVDDSGNVYVIGTSSELYLRDIIIIKYGPDGEQLWVQYYDHTTEGGYDIDIGENGMIYAVGYSNSMMITLQYNTEGELQWASTYDGADAEGLDIGKSLVLDASSNVYITGFSKGIGGLGTNRDITTVKYNTEGEQQWAAIYDGSGNSSDEGYEIALDEMNNVYVLGYSNAEDSHVQFATLKYNENGEQEWVNRFYNPESLVGTPRALAVFDSQNIYVTGTAGLGITTVKINNIGDTVWTQNYNSVDYDQAGTDIVTDLDGNIYVTGWVRDGGGTWTRDYGTLKYNPDGDLLWDIWYEGLGGGRDDALNICLDNENNVIITGQTDTETTSYDIGTIKYTQSGSTVEGYSSEIEINIYPNPAAGIVNLHSSTFTQQPFVVEVYDLNGRKLHEQNIPKGTNTVEINASELMDGLYFCKVSTDQKSTIKKLIIQH